MSGPALTIICARCNAAVSKIEWHVDHVTRGIRMTAFCHGEKDTRLFDPDDLRDQTVLHGTAFNTPTHIIHRHPGEGRGGA